MIKRFLWKILAIPMAIVIFDILPYIFNFSASLIRLDQVDFGFPLWLDMLIDIGSGVVSWFFVQAVFSLSQNSKENVTNILSIIIGFAVGVLVHVFLKYWIFITIILSGLLLTTIIICVSNYIKNKKEKLMELNGVEIKQETVLEIGKFTILWAEFEKKYCGTRCSSDKIWQFTKNHIVNNKYLNNFSQVLKGRADLYNNYTLVPEEAKSPSEADLKTIEDFIAYKGENTMAGAFLSIYRIRNNLLHGMKVVSELDGQIKLFRAMNDILMNIEYLRRE